MDQILTTATGFFSLIFLANILKKMKVLALEDKDLLGKLLLNVCLPAVIIMSFQNFEFNMSLIVALVAGGLANLTGIFVGYLLSRKRDKQGKAMLMMLTSGYNIGIFTIPFASNFFSASAVLAVLMFDVGNAIFVMGVSAAIVSGVLNNDKGNPLPAIFDKMRRSPTIIVYVLMFLWMATGIPIPTQLFDIANIPASATSFLAMTMVGVMLDFKIDPQERSELFQLLFLRYAYAFVLAGLIFYFIPLDIEIRKAMMIGVLSPMSTATMVFAQTFGCKPSLVGGAGTFSILFSMIFIVCVSLMF